MKNTPYCKWHFPEIPSSGLDWSFRRSAFPLKRTFLVAFKLVHQTALKRDHPRGAEFKAVLSLISYSPWGISKVSSLWSFSTWGTHWVSFRDHFRISYSLSLVQPSYVAPFLQSWQRHLQRQTQSCAWEDSSQHRGWARIQVGAFIPVVAHCWFRCGLIS